MSEPFEMVTYIRGRNSFVGVIHQTDVVQGVQCVTIDSTFVTVEEKTLAVQLGMERVVDGH
jgi:hypothetical protein